MSTTICIGPDCGRVLHRGRGVAPPGTWAHAGRGLCDRCYWRFRHADVLIDQRRTLRGRDDVLNDWVRLRRRGLNKREAANALGMTVSAFEKAYERARAAGDPRARTGLVTA